MKKKIFIFILFLVSSFLYGCGGDDSNLLVSSNSNINVDVDDDIVKEKTESFDIKEDLDYIPINLSGRYSLVIEGKKDDPRENIVKINTKDYGSWNMDINMDSSDLEEKYIYENIIEAMYYYPQKKHIFFTITDSRAGHLIVFRSYYYYPETKKLEKLEPGKNCIPKNMKVRKDSNRIVYGQIHGLNTKYNYNMVYDKDVWCDISTQQEISKSIANLIVQKKYYKDIDYILRYYRALGNKERAAVAKHNRKKGGEYLDKDKIKGIYSNILRSDVVDILPVDAGNHIYRIITDLISKEAVSRYINEKKIVENSSGWYIEYVKAIDSFHIPNLSLYEIPITIDKHGDGDGYIENDIYYFKHKKNGVEVILTPPETGIGGGCPRASEGATYEEEKECEDRWHKLYVSFLNVWVNIPSFYYFHAGFTSDFFDSVSSSKAYLMKDNDFTSSDICYSSNDRYCEDKEKISYTKNSKYINTIKSWFSKATTDMWKKAINIDGY